MGIRRDVQRRIDKKRQEITDLEAQISAAKNYLRGMEDTLKLLPKEDASGGGAGKVLRPGSHLARARDAIKQAGKPMHVNDLLDALGRELTRMNRSGLSGSMAAYVRRGEIFTRPAPNTFGLVEMSSNGVSAKNGVGEPSSDLDDQPPPDFGQE